MLIDVQYSDGPPENVTAHNAVHSSFPRNSELGVSQCTTFFLLGSPLPRQCHAHAQKIRVVQNGAYMSGSNRQWSNVHTCMIISVGFSFFELGKEKLLESPTSFPAQRTPNVYARCPFQVAVSTCSLFQSRNVPCSKDSPGFLQESSTQP